MTRPLRAHLIRAAERAGLAWSAVASMSMRAS